MFSISIVNMRNQSCSPENRPLSSLPRETELICEYDELYCILYLYIALQQGMFQYLLAITFSTVRI